MKAHQTLPVDVVGELSPNTDIHSISFDFEDQNRRIHCVYQCLVTAHKTLPVDVVGELSPNTDIHSISFDLEVQNQRIHSV